MNRIFENSAVKAAAEGDTEKFEVLVRQYLKDIYRRSLSLVTEPDDAAALTWETFVTAYNSLDGYKGKESFISWVSAINEEVCREFLRHNAQFGKRHSEGDEKAAVPEFLAERIMAEIGACAAAKKRKKHYKTAGTVLLCALLVLAGVKFLAIGGPEKFFPNDKGASATATETADVINSQTAQEEYKASPLNINADRALISSEYGDEHELYDAAAVSELEELLAPIYEAKKAPQSRPAYTVSLCCGDEAYRIEVYLDDTEAFVDLGQGPFLAAGSPEKILDIIK